MFSFKAFFGSLSLTLFLVGIPLFGESFRNLRVFVGERASGMGGAYSAISDDPSGAYYNPAGMAFSSDNSFSISANAYSETSKQSKDVFGPGSDYTRTSRAFYPNFIGTTKKIDSIMAGISVINTRMGRFDQNDQIYYPLESPSTSKIEIDYSEDIEEYLIGFSLGKLINDKFALGFSGYYIDNSERFITNQYIRQNSNTYSSFYVKNKKTARGFMPVFGLQFMPIEKLSLGFSLRKILNISSKSSSVGRNTSSNDTGTDTVSEYIASENNSLSIANSQVLYGPPRLGSLPEQSEFRGGLAFFMNKNLLFALDFIYTSGFKKSLDRNQYGLNTNAVYLKNSNDMLLYREQTKNYAFGLEYFITENLAIRMGAYTNFSNNRRKEWMESAVVQAMKASSNITLSPNVFYQAQEFETSPREEDADTKGFTFGFSWALAKSSISLTFVTEKGVGASYLGGGLPQQFIYKNNSVLLTASSHN
ncbi:MAG: hypothetical protein H7A25_21920 [Leptospiraceae bacterium]|nr:hypothetical protein [Leptospiraceae bacterium]MCP5502572.1 hypothetical protein [Leptospiraceae bacterium]